MAPQEGLSSMELVKLLLSKVCMEIGSTNLFSVLNVCVCIGFTTGPRKPEAIVKVKEEIN
jgi:hypothetical protein